MWGLEDSGTAGGFQGKSQYFFFMESSICAHKHFGKDPENYQAKTNYETALLKENAEISVRSSPNV